MAGVLWTAPHARRPEHRPGHFLRNKQAKNTDAERRACEIRLRAERRTGELLRDLARATPAEAGAQGGRGNEKSASNAATSFDTPPVETKPPPSAYADTLQRIGQQTGNTESHAAGCTVRAF